MPGYVTHITASAAIGLTGGLALVFRGGLQPDVSLTLALAGMAGGLVPDLDSDTGRPLRIAMGLVSFLTGTSIFLFLSAQKHFLYTDWTPERAALAVGGLLLILNTVGVTAFKTITRHRGMFHSLPTAVAYALVVALMISPLGPRAAFFGAALGLAGTLSHLFLDAATGLTLKPLKFYSGRPWPDLTAWSLVALLAVIVWKSL